MEVLLEAALHFGYQKSPENPHKLILKEPEASIVRELFEAYAAGTSVKELVKHCQQKAYPSPDAKAGWSSRSIYRILANECYTGKNSAGKDKDSQLQKSSKDTDSARRVD